VRIRRSARHGDLRTKQATADEPVAEILNGLARFSGHSFCLDGDFEQISRDHSLTTSHAKQEQVDNLRNPLMKLY
jgi:hypothetical protein